MITTVLVLRKECAVSVPPDSFLTLLKNVKLPIHCAKNSILMVEPAHNAMLASV